MADIVWAEDSDNDQMLIACALEDLGPSPPRPSWVFAGDGQEAIEACRREHPALVVLDVKMPRVDGMEALRRIRAEPAPQPRIVMFSSSFRPADVEVAQQLGAGYVQKPLEFHDFCAAVRSIVASARDAPHASSAPS